MLVPYSWDEPQLPYECGLMGVGWTGGPFPKFRPERRDKGSLSLHPSYLEQPWLQIQKQGGDSSIRQRGESPE